MPTVPPVVGKLEALRQRGMHAPARPPEQHGGRRQADLGVEGGPKRRKLELGAEERSVLVERLEIPAGSFTWTGGRDYFWDTF